MARPKGRRPSKPRPNFPLFPHADGTWKPTALIDGKRPSFGPWTKDPRGEIAYQRYRAAQDAREHGRKPAPTLGVVSVEGLFDRYLTARDSDVYAGSIEAGTYQDIKTALAEFARTTGPTREASGLTPDDFAKARDIWRKRLGPYSLNRFIGHVRAAFRFGETHRLIERAPWYGSSFDKLPARLKRQAAWEAEQAHGKRLLSPPEIATLLRTPMSAPMQAMILLGLNCGFLGIDCARLTKSALDLDARRLEFMRHKTATCRAAVLWPETTLALRAALAVRPQPADAVHADLVFLTRQGRPWVHDVIHRTSAGISKVVKAHAVALMFGRLLESAGLKRKGLNFGSLRKTFRTAADTAQDRNAVLTFMGHCLAGMDPHYVMDISHERLSAVANHVRTLLLADYLKPKAGSPGRAAPRKPAASARRPARVRG